MENQTKIKAMSEKNKMSSITAEELEKNTITTFRKHLSWYFKSSRLHIEIPNIKEFRARLVRVQSIEELENILVELENTAFCLSS